MAERYCLLSWESIYAGKVVVVCNQTGKMINTSTSSLSKENGETLTEKDLATGTQLLFNSDGKDYPVTVINNSEKSKG